MVILLSFFSVSPKYDVSLPSENIEQLDGTNDESTDEEEDEVYDEIEDEVEEEEEDEHQPNKKRKTDEEEEELNSGDDTDEDSSALFRTEDVLICKLTKVKFEAEFLPVFSLSSVFQNEFRWFSLLNFTGFFCRVLPVLLVEFRRFS